MYLDAVRSKNEPVYDAEVSDSENAICEPWEHWRPAELSHHGRSCCEVVKEWVIATDLSLLGGGSELTGPRWLRHRFEWGPTRYPIHWCEIGRASVLDCGVHAALAHEIFLARGIRSFRAQMIQEYSENAAEQWQMRWEERDAITSWIDGVLIYHEGCATVTNGNVLKLWDPSSSWWVDPGTTAGYGSIRAVRIAGPIGAIGFRWGCHALTANEWIVIGKEEMPLTPTMTRANRTYGSVRPLPVPARLRSV